MCQPVIQCPLDAAHSSGMKLMMRVLLAGVALIGLAGCVAHDGYYDDSYYGSSPTYYGGSSYYGGGYYDRSPVYYVDRGRGNDRHRGDRDHWRESRKDDDDRDRGRGRRDRDDDRRWERDRNDRNDRDRGSSSRNRREDNRRSYDRRSDEDRDAGSRGGFDNRPSRGELNNAIRERQGSRGE